MSKTQRKIKKSLEKRKLRIEAQRVGRKLKRICKCGSRDKTQIHHKDQNRNNNSIYNLEILCESCHRKVHNLK